MKMGMCLPRARTLLRSAVGRLGGDGWDMARQPRKTFGPVGVGVHGFDGTRPSDDEDFVAHGGQLGRLGTRGG